MSEKLVKKILWAEKTLDRAELDCIHAKIYPEQVERGEIKPFRHDYVHIPADFRKALDEIKKYYDVLITDLRLDTKGGEHIGPHDQSKGAYLAARAKEINSFLVTILCTGAGTEFRQDEFYMFDRIFSANDDVEEILRFLDERLN